VFTRRNEILKIFLRASFSLFFLQKYEFILEIRNDDDSSLGVCFERFDESYRSI